MAIYCLDCGGEVIEDASPGVYLHFSEEAFDEIDHDLDADHVARPEIDEDDSIIERFEDYQPTRTRINEAIQKALVGLEVRTRQDLTIADLGGASKGKGKILSASVEETGLIVRVFIEPWGDAMGYALEELEDQ